MESEGDAFYERNKDTIRLPDPVLDTMAACQLKPQTIFEVGCGNGWRLVEINKLYRPVHISGCDASKEAIENKVFQNVFCAEATSALSHIKASFYDTVIFGFCLYLMDREDLLMIAAHADRLLRDKGHIIIHDFLPEYSYKNAYKHKEGIWSYKMDYSRLWLSHPGYKIIVSNLYGEDDERTAVTILQKDYASAFPERKI